MRVQLQLPLPRVSRGYGSMIRSVVILTVVSCSLFLFGQEGPKRPQREPVLLDVLTRVVNAAGGAQSLASVHDLTESGDITFRWEEDVKGPVTIRAIGGNRFRMEADLPDGKTTWIVKDGSGTKQQGDQKAIPLSGSNAANFGNFTFPIAYLAAAIRDPNTDISLVGIETREARSVYRIRVDGRLDVIRNQIAGVSVRKDVLVDALSFEIMSVEDSPFPVYQRNGKLSDSPPREITYGDFRVVNGVLVPFLISEKVHGQSGVDIRLDKVVFNTGLSDTDFTQ